MPFPDTEYFAAAEFLIGCNRPGHVIYQMPVNVRCC
jgi:hypothetical protein